MPENTFVVKKICPVCEKTTRIIKTRSRIKVLSHDEDGFTRYENFNTCYYTIWLCEHCGFAADEKTFTSKIPDRYLKNLREFLLAKKMAVPFTDERTLDEAINSFSAALRCLEFMRGKASKRAKYFHQMAWIFRDAKDTIQEKDFLKLAAESYEEALATEHFPINTLTDNMVIYLIAAIYYRLGDEKKTTIYLSQIMNDQSVRELEPRIFDRARDLWGEIRAARKKK